MLLAGGLFVGGGWWSVGGCCWRGWWLCFSLPLGAMAFCAVERARGAMACCAVARARGGGLWW